MNILLKPSQMIGLGGMNAGCTVKRFIGGGGQGEVYAASLDGGEVALKWYFSQTATAEQRTALEKLIETGPPDSRFLWPMALSTANGVKGFGYIMPLRENRFKSIVDLMKRRVNPSFRALATAAMELSHSFLQLHMKGLCYRDISFGNVFFDPNTGDIAICDNDNVTIDGSGTKGGILGTPRFMAPEVVRGDAMPKSSTDLFSLAVLMFYFFMVHHPLEGRRESEIKCFDLPAMNKLYGTEPVFIFDPQNDSNRPVPGYHDNATTFWGIYPDFFRTMFVKSFTDGIRDPAHGRVRESEWRATIIKLRDSIVYCAGCGAENFFDAENAETSGSAGVCWSCKRSVIPPLRLRIGKDTVMLNHDTKLFPHHTDRSRRFDFTHPVAEMSRAPHNPNLWGLKNLTSDKWVATKSDGALQDVAPGRSISLANGTTIRFGNCDGMVTSG